MSEATSLVDQAIGQVITASAVLAQGIADPGPAAGPRAAFAAVPMNLAGERFGQAADVLERVDGEVALALRARRLRDDAFARARELAGAAFIPWPFVYGALGLIVGGVRGVLTDAQNFRSSIPVRIPLEPVAQRFALSALHEPYAYGAQLPAYGGAPSIAGYASPSYSAQRIMPMRVQAKAGSPVEARYYQRGLPGNQLPMPKAIAPGVSPRPLEDLIFHGGKTVPKMAFQNIYLGPDSEWSQSDVTSIDESITLAMRDKRLNNVMAQYFDTALECDVVASKLLNDARPNRLDEPDIQAKIIALFRSGQIAATDLDRTIFNFILPRGSVLALDTADSLNGLGGYHGSVHVTHEGRPITLYYSANVYSEGSNGIDVFDKPWKNVVATLYHELNEFRTDADVQDAIVTGNNDFLGWMSRTGKEVGDEPIAVARTLDLVFKEVVTTKSNKRVPVQFMYSNAVHGPEGPIEAPDRHTSTSPAQQAAAPVV